MKKQHVKLSEQDRTYLESLIGKGKLPAKTYKRAIALLELNRGSTFKTVAQMVGVTQHTASIWADKYRTAGLAVLTDKARSGRPVEIDGMARAKVTALACSEAPEGYERWTLRLLADKAVELAYCAHLSHTEVADILKKTNFNPT